jgi:hypothetical protein
MSTLSKVRTATKSTNFPNTLVLHLESGERTLLGAKQLYSFTGLSNINSPGAMHSLRGAEVEYSDIKEGDDIGNGVVATRDGHKIDLLILSLAKSNLIQQMYKDTDKDE